MRFIIKYTFVYQLSNIETYKPKGVHNLWVRGINGIMVEKLASCDWFITVTYNVSRNSFRTPPD